MTYRQLQTKDGQRFHYLDAGTGEATVLLHRSAGASSAWMPVVDHLSPGFRALAPDLLGYGPNAPWPRGTRLRPDSELAVAEALHPATDRLDRAQGTKGSLMPRSHQDRGDARRRRRNHVAVFLHVDAAAPAVDAFLGTTGNGAPKQGD